MSLNTVSAYPCLRCGQGLPVPGYCLSCMSVRPDVAVPPLVCTIQTCPVCPSQWNAWDATSQYYYLRFRGGRGTVETAASEEDYQVNGPTALIASFCRGDRWDNEITLEEFLALAGMRSNDSETGFVVDLGHIYLASTMVLYGSGSCTWTE